MSSGVSAGERQELLRPQLPGSPPARPSFLLHACRVLNVLSGISAILCAVAFGMALVVRASAEEKDLDFHSGQAVRVYGIIVALLLLLAETEWERFLALAPILDHWVGRSAVMVFESCLTYREAYPSGSTDFHKSLALYRSAASASLLACGAVYLLGGVLCIGAIRKARFRREEALVRAAADLEAIETRRKELHRLLGRAPE